MTEILPPHVERMVVENGDLEGKITKLQAFTTTDTFVALPQVEQSLLGAQLAVMLSYSTILMARLEIEMGKQ